MTVLSGAECVKALRRVGYTKLRQRGSHVRMHCPGRRPVTVPLHGTVPRGTLRSILRLAGVAPGELVGSARVA